MTTNIKGLPIYIYIFFYVCVCVLQAHYDLAIGVALWWLGEEEEQDVFDRDIM